MIENKNGLYNLLGIPETSILPANPGDMIIIRVDRNNTQEQMWAYGNMVKELLPDHKVLVLPDNVDISYFPEDFASRMIGAVSVREDD